MAFLTLSNPWVNNRDLLQCVSFSFGKTKYCTLQWTSLLDSVLKIVSLFDQDTSRKEEPYCKFQVAWPHLNVDVPACLTTMWNWLIVLRFSYPLHKWMMDDSPRERFAVFVFSLKAVLLGWMLPYQILTLNAALGDTRVFILADIWYFCSLRKIFS